jgi:hypothetical protein
MSITRHTQLILTERDEETDKPSAVIGVNSGPGHAALTFANLGGLSWVQVEPSKLREFARALENAATEMEAGA